MSRSGTPDRTIACVVGTRPEAVKMAPVVLRLRQAEGLQVRLISTGQHRELLDQALADFGLVADRELALMRPGQSLAEITSRSLMALDEVFEAERPDFVLAQGDTTTVLASAMASYYRQVPFGHVEAGLRTGQPYRPFPEEKNRVLGRPPGQPPLRPHAEESPQSAPRRDRGRLDPRHRQPRDRRPPDRRAGPPSPQPPGLPKAG